MCPWIPLRAVTGFGCRVAAELCFSVLWRSRERILFRFLEFETARNPISRLALTSRFNLKPHLVQEATRVFELLVTLPPQREHVLEVSLARTLIVFNP